MHLRGHLLHQNVPEQRLEVIALLGQFDRGHLRYGFDALDEGPHVCPVHDDDRRINAVREQESLEVVRAHRHHELSHLEGALQGRHEQRFRHDQTRQQLLVHNVDEEEENEEKLDVVLEDLRVRVLHFQDEED